MYPIRRAAMLLSILGGLSLQVSGTDSLDRTSEQERGQYLTIIGGCNDCHTPGYAEAGGNIPERRWLTGNPVGFKGPWGTTYASNLRLSVLDVPEESWIAAMKTRQAYPPMPWPALNRMTEGDLRAIYRYISALGKAGEPAPVYVPPGIEPRTPYVVFEPVHLERLGVPGD